MLFYAVSIKMISGYYDFSDIYPKNVKEIENDTETRELSTCDCSCDRTCGCSCYNTEIDDHYVPDMRNDPARDCWIFDIGYNEPCCNGEPVCDCSCDGDSKGNVDYVDYQSGTKSDPVEELTIE